jgi:lipoprotein-anchoring transpeptidase ErfK/SrfK
MIAEQKPTGRSRNHHASLFAFVLVIGMAVRASDSQVPDQPIVPKVAAELRHERKVLVSIPHRQLALIEDGEVAKIYPVAVGAPNSPSPTGTFAIKNRLVKPTYFHPGVVIPAGPDNPLGTRWIGLSTKAYGIHGTNVEDSIGKAASHGCIRMHRADLEELFAALQVGDEVEIRGQADDELAQIFGSTQEEEDASPDTTTVAAAVDDVQPENSAVGAQAQSTQDNF